MRICVPFLFFLFLSGFLQAQKKIIAVIGSSSAYGFGATPIDSSWVNLTKRYFKSQGLIDTIYNLGNPSSTTYAGMPDNFVPPPKRPSPDPVHNISKALRYNPDVVIVNFPSNDIGYDYSITEYLFNLRTIYKAVVSAKKICYVTTTQPRDYFSPTEKNNLKIARDSILREFGAYSMDFYDPVVDNATLNIKAIYNYDGTHVNNAGHQLFFQIVKSKKILASGPPAFTLTSFNASLQNNNALIKWSTLNDQTTTLYEVQRSTDSLSFQTIHKENGKGGTPGVDYAWTDAGPLSGKVFYRLKITNNNVSNYSGIISIIYKDPRGFSLTGFSDAILGNAALISWSTLNDQTTTIYEVQRCSDSLSFQTIHQETGKGVTPSAIYSWMDSTPLNGKSFYRLKMTVNNIGNYSGIISLIDIIPPVFSLTGLSAALQSKVALISWSTLNDLTSTRYEVQRGSDSLSFQTIHQENGKGGTPSAVYSWTDTTPLSGKGFYRLKITANGNLSYSITVCLINVWPPAFSLTSFTADQENSNVRLGWTTQYEKPSTSFEIQRSPDSLQFETIHQENGKGMISSTDYSWTDMKPLMGKGFYRIKISVNGTLSYSIVISIYTLEKSFYIVKMYTAGKNSNLVIYTRIGKNQGLMITIINSSGAVIRKQSYSVQVPATNIPVNIAGLANGVYYIRITASNGDQEIRPFMNF